MQIMRFCVPVSTGTSKGKINKLLKMPLDLISIKSKGILFSNYSKFPGVCPQAP